MKHVSIPVILRINREGDVSFCFSVPPDPPFELFEPLVRCVLGLFKTAHAYGGGLMLSASSSVQNSRVHHMCGLCGPKHRVLCSLACFPQHLFPKPLNFELYALRGQQRFATASRVQAFRSMVLCLGWKICVLILRKCRGTRCVKRGMFNK